jgi:hypothetical protein
MHNAGTHASSKGRTTAYLQRPGLKEMAGFIATHNFGVVRKEQHPFLSCQHMKPTTEIRNPVDSILRVYS